MIQCYLDMHKPSTTSKPQSPSKRKPPSVEPLLDNPGWQQEQRSRWGVNAQGGIQVRQMKQLALLWTVAEHFISSFVTLWGLQNLLKGGAALWTCSYSAHLFRKRLRDRDLANFLLFLCKKNNNLFLENDSVFLCNIAWWSQNNPTFSQMWWAEVNRHNSSSLIKCKFVFTSKWLSGM